MTRDQLYSQYCRLPIELDGLRAAFRMMPNHYLAKRIRETQLKLAICVKRLKRE